MNQLVLWFAQGFGAGRLPVTPGTFGSILGLPWVMLLLWTGNIWWFSLGVMIGIAASVWLCGRAEQILSQTDPSSVVIDEMVAMPVCFAAWISLSSSGGDLPPPQSLVTGQGWLWSGGILVAFRVFDIAKPWPVRQSQALPGGWGVTTDDLLAAVYVNATVIAAWGTITLLS